jgi:urease gamma subunit
MKLTLKEQERLIIFDIAEIARRRWARGLKLNYIEANAIICDEMLERARAGVNTLAELIQIGSDHYGRRCDGRHCTIGTDDSVGSDAS